MSDSAAPGWYHAEGDPPNTERYWDGFAWTEGPRPIAPATPGVPLEENPASASTDMPVMGGADETVVSPSLDAVDTPNVDMANNDMANNDMAPTDRFDAPSTAAPSGMPVTGSSMPVTGSGGGGGLDDGFPSMDDAPVLGSYDAAPSNLPGDSPGGFTGAATPPVDVPQGFPPASNMPATGAPGQGLGAFGGGFTEESQATTSLVLSIVGVFCCGLPAVIGAYMGWSEKQGIDEGRRDPSNRGMAIASLVIAGLALAIWGLVALLFFLGAAFV